MLKWICERLDGTADAQQTPIGMVPTKAALDVSGLTLTDEQLDLLLTVDPDVWNEEAAHIPKGYKIFGDRLPDELWKQYEALVQRLEAGKKRKAVG